MKRWSPRTLTFLWVMASVFLVFFRSRWALRAGGHDEDCYLQWLHWMLGLPYPPCYSTAHTAGIAVLWWPIGLFARGVSAVTGVAFLPIVKPLIAFFSFLTWGFCLFLIDAILKVCARGKKVPVWVPIAVLANIPFLEFAVKVNFWSHTGEMALCLGSLLSCLQRRFWLASALAALATFTRLNDAPLFFLVAGAYLDAQTEIPFSRNAKTYAAGAAGLVLFVLGYLVWRVGFVTGYNGVTIPMLGQLLSVNRITSTFTAGNDGLMWMAGWYLFCFLIGVARLKSLSWTARAGLFWMLAEIALVIGTNGIRSDYVSPVWRYLLGSYVAALLIWGETESSLFPLVKKLGMALLVIFALWMPFQTYVIDGVTIQQSLGVQYRYFPTGHNLQRLEFLLYPGALIKLLGQGPVGFTLFSWCYENPIFAGFRHYGKYALRGIELWAMTVASLAAVLAWLGLTALLYQRRNQRGA